MPGSSADSSRELDHAIQAFDVAFSSRRLDDVASLFSQDAQLLVHQRPGVSSKEVIRSAFALFFEQFDVLAYEPTYELIDIYEDHAYVLGAWTQVLRPRDGSPNTKIHGRTVQFWRREDGHWRLDMLLTARFAPDEQVS